jgi:hypothetical protein
MGFLAHCPECGKRVTVVTVLGGAALDRALENDEDVEAVCFLQEHRWNLSEQDKAHLRSIRSR